METRGECRDELLSSNPVRCIGEAERWDGEARNCTAVANALAVKTPGDVDFFFVI